jgi:hypothetical protein
MGILLPVLPLRSPPVRIEGGQERPLVDEDEADTFEVRFLDISKMTDDPADRPAAIRGSAGKLGGREISDQPG